MSAARKTNCYHSYSEIDNISPKEKSSKMIEVVGNLWTYKTPDGRDPDVRVITTNGTVKKNGECVMGRGCALEAKQRWPHIAETLGRFLNKFGNVPFQLMLHPEILWTFPVKHNWHEKADITLIEQSARRVVRMVNDDFDEQLVVVMPRPGCGNGGLRWEDVKPVLEPILDDRFHVITFGKE
jgi:hypothetical protein